MKKVKFHFYKNKGWLSQLIRWKTGGVYSHVGVELDGVFYHSLIGKGVLKETEQYPDVVETIELSIPDIEYGKCKQVMESILGERYDRVAIASFVLNLSVEENSSYFCTEQAEMCMEIIDPRWPQQDRLTSPELFYQQLMFYQMIPKL